jgi:hypothetical protein
MHMSALLPHGKPHTGAKIRKYRPRDPGLIEDEMHRFPMVLRILHHLAFEVKDRLVGGLLSFSKFLAVLVSNQPEGWTALAGEKRYSVRCNSADNVVPPRSPE